MADDKIVKTGQTKVVRIKEATIPPEMPIIRPKPVKQSPSKDEKPKE